MEKLSKFFCWTPRVLAILMAAFISIFALDVFTEGYFFWETLGALFIHLVPAFVLVVGLIVAWKWKDIGGLIFIVLGVIYLFWLWGRAPDNTSLFIIAGPLFLIGILFIISKFLGTKNYESQEGFTS